MNSPPRIRKVAVIGASHWHSIYDASYLKLLRDLGIDIVGVSDPDPALANARASAFGSKAFTDDDEMLDSTKPEFVLAMGRHVDMPAIFRRLLRAGLPFIMEKPWGTRIEDVRALAEESRRLGAWVAVPFMTRYTHWAQKCREVYHARQDARPSHMTFRMIRPTAHRYVQWDSPWMLERSQAGGGALINLGSHGFDICRFITGEEPEVLSCVLSRRVENCEVEDYAHVVLKTPSGLIVHNEVGYTMPTWPLNATDGERKLALSDRIVRAVDGGVETLNAQGTQREATPADYIGGHKRVLMECLDAAARGAPPPVTADDCLRAGELIHAAYAAATWA